MRTYYERVSCDCCGQAIGDRSYTMEGPQPPAVDSFRVEFWDSEGPAGGCRRFLDLCDNCKRTFLVRSRESFQVCNHCSTKGPEIVHCARGSGHAGNHHGRTQSGEVLEWKSP